MQNLNIPPLRIASDYDPRWMTVKYFGFFDKETVKIEAGRLLMLDIDLGRNCSLRCPTCFRKDNIVDDNCEDDLLYEEILNVVLDAKMLGLREVKICGAGEPFEYPKILDFARFLTKHKIGLSIFTKGHVLGDDNIVRKIFGKFGFTNAIELCKEFYTLKTSLLVGFQSFNDAIQDKIVGNIRGYTERRNRAIENLVSVGFNSTLPTRLALCALPIIKDTYNELFDIYKFCRERNILPLIAPLMCSGKQFGDLYIKEIDVSSEKKIELYTTIYKYNISNKIQSAHDISEGVISPMAGIHPCNQISAGLYLTLNGNVLRCPGSNDVLGNIRTESLKKIWLNSPNYLLRGKYNCFCPAKDGKTITKNFYRIISRKISIPVQI